VCFICHRFFAQRVKLDQENDPERLVGYPMAFVWAMETKQHVVGKYVSQLKKRFEDLIPYDPKNK